jgi:uncharacterized protein YkwD
LLVLAAGLAAFVPAAAATGHRQANAAHGCPNADTRATHASTQAMRAGVLCLVNRERTSRHLRALHELRRLDRSAQGWTNSMVRSGSFAHARNGSDPAARITAAGYAWSSIGENIATGLPTPRAVVSVWMSSTGHCRNILAPNFTDIGIGVSPHPVGGAASGPATWTEDFGLPMGEPAPSGNWGPADGCPY